MLLENVLGQPTCTALGTVSRRMGQREPRVGDEVYIHLVSGGRTRLPLKYFVLCCSSVHVLFISRDVTDGNYCPWLLDINNDENSWT